MILDPTSVLSVRSTRYALHRRCDLCLVVLVTNVSSMDLLSISSDLLAEKLF
jgi:hypothetical protein